MAQIAFLLLAHKDPAGVVEQARQLAAAGDAVAIHYDARAPRAEWDAIREGLGGEAGVAFARRRLRCGWGQWSLVQATILACEAALAAFPRATHLYLMSGDCVATKSSAFARAMLDADDADLIESVDFHEGGWIKTGLREERLRYRHWANERTHKRLFYASMNLQRRLGLDREPPADVQVMIGSQWWCLRRRTVEAILRLCRERPDIPRFFRTTWIPDETFFQTLVRHLVPEPEVRSRTPTFLMFSDYGMPVTFHDDHHDLLIAQDCVLARKASPGAVQLKRRLGRLWSSGRADFSISNEGRRLYGFLAGQGRVGRRFAPRAWEGEAAGGAERELLVVASKKWHVAKRLVGAVKRHAPGLPCVDFLFNEEATALPDLGGIQATLAKRERHRRALMRMLFDAFGSDRLLICLDTGNLELLRDLYGGRALARVLEVEGPFSDEYLAGHARRLGLAGARTGPEAMARLLPAIRLDVAEEERALREARLPRHERLAESAPEDANARALAAFLSVPPAVAEAIAATPALFAD